MQTSPGNSGAARWKAAKAALTPPLVRSRNWPLNGIGYPPAIVGDRVVLSFAEAAIGAFALATGDVLWKTALPCSYDLINPVCGEVLALPPVLITRCPGMLYWLDEGSGAIVRAAELDTDLYLGGAVAADGILYATAYGAEGGEVLALDLATGGTRWRVAVPGVARQPVTLCRGCLVVHGERSQKMIGLDARDGRQLWEFSVAELGRHKTVIGKQILGHVSGEVRAVDDVLIVPVRAARIVALEIDSGRERWSCTLPFDYPGASDVDADRRLHIVGPKQHLVLDTSTGEQIAETDIAGAMESTGILLLGSLTMSATALFFFDFISGAVAGLDKATGSLLWTDRCDAAIPALYAPVITDRMLFLVDAAGGRLHAFAGSEDGRKR